MRDHGLQKSHASAAPPVAKTEHNFSVERLLQHRDNRGEQGNEAAAGEPVKCALGLEERVIKDSFTSWLNSPRYNPAS